MCSWQQFGMPRAGWPPAKGNSVVTWSNESADFTCQTLRDDAARLRLQRLGRRQTQPELGPLAIRADQFKGAALRFGELISDTQPQTHSRNSRVGAGPVKSLKDVRNMIGRNGGSGIEYSYFHRPVLT